MALLVSLATLAAAGAALVTVRQAAGEQRLTRDGQVTDRYTAAVTNLGDTAEEVRIGGMYALQRIAQDSTRDAPTVVQVLSAYVRSHTPEAKKGVTGPDQPANDVAAALTILAAPLAKGVPVDLHGAYLHGAHLHRAYLHRAELSGANLSGAELSGATLSGADLSGADLSSANLRGADLSGSYVFGADVQDTDVTDADLSGVDQNGHAYGVTGWPLP
ncbi:pentapeptide repeat-containing protein [Streptomyces sp. NPDC096013]|uniref:pentapeptide repeat-containing protein n=1 Tax=Streptomyces sp. NPDC096013 TaxID=3366069 RepID=UPI00380B64F6